MGFWSDRGIKVLFGLGVGTSSIFFGWVFSLQSGLPVDAAVRPGQLFIYPILGLLTFVASMYLGRNLYATNRPIAYRIMATSFFFHLFWIVLTVWAVRHI